MTADRGRRRRLDRWMALGSFLIVALLVTLIAVGIVSLRNYTAARPTATTQPKPELGLPTTKTALLGTVDAKGVLASLTVFVLSSNGLGGSIVSVPVNGSAGLDDDGSLRSFQGVYSVQGETTLVAAVQGALSMRFDYWTVGTVERATALLLPIAPLPVTLAEPVRETIDGTPRVRFEAGEYEFTAEEIAAVLSARVDNAPEALRRAPLMRIWTAVATKVGPGLGAAPAAVDSIDSLVVALYAGPVGARGLTTSGPARDAEDDAVSADIEELNLAEVIFLFASVAPSAIDAPRSGPTFRLVAPAGFDLRVQNAVSTLLFVQGNVLSISLDGPNQPVTQVFVTDVESETAETMTAAFPGAEVVQTESPIAGIDVTVVLGTDFLSQPPPAVATTTTASTDGTTIDDTTIDDTTIDDTTIDGTTTGETGTDTTAEATG